jgi:hypothetical protein
MNENITSVDAAIAALTTARLALFQVDRKRANRKIGRILMY